MPFTLAHPAAVIPIRRYGVFSALVVGSIMPDMLYFIPGVPRSAYGHTLPGLFFFCLPVGFAVLWLYHMLLKRPLIALFPAGQRQKLAAVSEDFRFLPVGRTLAIMTALLLGAASHITWDSFTHYNGWAVVRFDFLRVVVHLPLHITAQVSDLLQYVTSIFGLALIVVYYWRWHRTTTSSAPAREMHLPEPLRVMLLWAFAIGAVAPGVARLILNPSFWLRARRGLLGYSAIDGLKVVTAEVLLFAVAWHIVRLLRHRPEQWSRE